MYMIKGMILTLGSPPLSALSVIQRSKDILRATRKILHGADDAYCTVDQKRMVSVAINTVGIAGGREQAGALSTVSC